VQWQSGVVSELTVARPDRFARPERRTIERLRALVAEAHPDEDIATRLNQEGLVTGHGLPWTTERVAHVRRRQGLRRTAQRKVQPVLPDRHPRTGAYSMPGAARHFGVSRDTIKSWIDRGLVRSYNERYGRYNARWLEIDDATAARLFTLARQ
jgi:hypothetical protein